MLEDRTEGIHMQAESKKLPSCCPDMWVAGGEQKKECTEAQVHDLGCRTQTAERLTAVSVLLGSAAMSLILNAALKARSSVGPCRLM